MRGIVNKITLYAAWEYDKEERDLNEASRRGLQLIKGGCFHSKFRKDSSVRYIYQLDYNPRLDDKIRYREMFEDQGWEYINSTYNGWHYFRKPYNEEMDEQDSHIYTDEQSLAEMQNRWLRLMVFFDIFYFVLGLYYLLSGLMENMLIILVEGIVFLALGITFLLGIINIKRKRRGKSGCFVLPMQIVLPIALLIFLTILFWGDLRLGYDRVFEERFTLGKIETEEIEIFSMPPSNIVIDKDGVYHIDLNCSVKGGLITITIQDEAGNSVYHVTAEKLTHDGTLDLEKGNYQVLYQFELDNNDPKSGSISVELEIGKSLLPF